MHSARFWINEFWKSRNTPSLKDPALLAIMETITQLDAVKQEQQEQAQKITALEHNSNYFNGYYTVAGYCSLLGEPISNASAKRMGFIMSKICREVGIDPHRVSHPVYGAVNAYPEALLSEHLPKYI